MKLKAVAVGAVLLVLVGQCDDAQPAPDVRDSSQARAGAERSAAPKAPRARPRRTPSASPTTSGPSPSASATAGQQAGRGTALAALGLLAVKGRAPMTGYDRDRFGPAWLDADRNGCDTRNDVLREHLSAITVEGNGCVVATGAYDDPYTGSRIDYRQGDGFLIDIDHVVSLGNAWATGAFRWDITTRAALANDHLNLLPADAGANRQKGDGDAATWLPSNKPFRCLYVARQVAVKSKYDLWLTAPEKAATERVLASCPDQLLVADTWGAPTRVDHDISDPGVPASMPTESPAPAVVGGGSTYFENCDAARSPGAAPVHLGDPGYGTHLDRDGDGTACE
ncbi:excalibur calcium-binding domain-containing protein [Nocardioides sp. Soil805]|uniref:excalibur calcium-binding domain-containing protein n=1 Tax=Nocardioides sp. Soil805 TaxID=1736416 RepID=UPI000702BBD4|nr:excalibur calcium-binding domain-containing protein [Nocardioides sp. Soil805]KRF34673.1 hypothetical protein ASG94_10870 [Nocardioides sp. Soil805]